MVEINERETSEFNRVLTMMLEDMISMEDNIDRMLVGGVVTFGFESLLDNLTIQNIMSMSMEEESEKVLVKKDEVELKFSSDVYKKKNDNIDMCCICMEELKNNEFIHNCSGCKQISHYSCMNEWVKRKIECPTCRFDMKDDIFYKDDFYTFIENELDI